MNTEWCYLHNGRAGSLGESCICGRSACVSQPSESEAQPALTSLRETQAALASKDALLRMAMEALRKASVTNSGLHSGTWHECKRALAAIEAELSQSPAPVAVQPSQWQDIATAPKDGPILAYNPVQGVYATRYDRGEWPHADWYSDDLGRDASIWYPRPTHWQPLPSAPLSASPEDKQ